MSELKPDKLYPGQPDRGQVAFAAIESARQIRQQMWEAAVAAQTGMASQRKAFQDYLNT